MLAGKKLPVGSFINTVNRFSNFTWKWMV